MNAMILKRMCNGGLFVGWLVCLFVCVLPLLLQDGWLKYNFPKFHYIFYMFVFL